MKVKLLTYTQNPIDVMWTAARTCYSEKSPIEIWDLDRYEQTQEDIDEGFELTCTWIDERQEKMWKLVKSILGSGHESLAEFVNFVFAIEGVSRSCMAQLTRHRAGIVFCVQSQRYVEIKEDYNTIKQLIEDCTNENEEIAIKSNVELQSITEKYFTDNSNANSYEYGKCLLSYLERINRGQKPEDARMILPNATKTNLVMSCNLRELIHICNLRLCCFDDKTEVLTTDGWKFFKDLKGNELFYSLNLETMEGEYTRSKEFFDNYYEGYMINVDSQSISLCITPNHKMLCSYSYDNKNFILDECSNNQKHKRILMKKNCKEIKGSTPTSFVLKGYNREDRNQYTSWVEKMSDKEVPIKEFLQILGFYISDGYAVKAGYHYTIGFSKGDKEKLIKYQKLLSKLTSNKSRIYEDGNAWKLEVHDRYLYNYFKSIGKVLEKHIPNDLFKLDSSLLIYLFNGLMDGDANKEGTSYWTSSKQLKDDFQRLCLHIGYSATITPIDRRGVKRTLKKGNKEHTFSEKSISYCISINKTKNEPIIKTTNRDAFSKSQYKGHVYCVELEKNNILYIRRKGKCVWSGNSRAQAEIRDLFIKIKEEVMKVDSRLGGLLLPNCEKLGYCPEHKCCGRTKTYKQLFDDSISKDDLQMIKDRTENPQRNENLEKLLNMESVFEESQSSWHPTENGRNLFTSLTEDED